MTKKIMTLHPQGKAGVNIDKPKYAAVRTAILDVLEEQGEVPFAQLSQHITPKIPNSDGVIGWYTTTVKLALAARNLIERLPHQSPQHLRLATPNA